MISGISFRNAIVISLFVHAIPLIFSIYWQSRGGLTPATSFPLGPTGGGLTRIRINFESAAQHGSIAKTKSPQDEVFTTTGLPSATTEEEVGQGGSGTESGGWDVPLYRFNPKPRYPREALRKNVEGTVILRVQVSSAGIAERVVIENSSGSPLLDEAAREAVEKWEFIPARRGNVPVESVSRIPIRFQIEEEK